MTSSYEEDEEGGPPLYKDMAKPLLEILNGGLSETVELTRESRSFIKTRLLWYRVTYPNGVEEKTPKYFNFERCSKEYLDNSDFERKFYYKTVTKENRYFYCVEDDEIFL